VAKVQLDILVNEQAYKDLQKSIDNAAKAQERANAITAKAQGNIQGAFQAAFNPLISNPAGGTGAGRTAQGTAAGAEASGISGALGSVGTKLAGVTAGLATVGFALKATTAIGNAANDPHLNDAQRERKLFRELVPFGSMMQDAVDAVTGRQGKIDTAKEEHQGRLFENAATAHMRAQIAAYMPRQAAAEEYATQMGKASSITTANVDTGRPFGQYKLHEGGQVDRSTYGGEVEYQERQRLLPVMREIAALERQTAVSSRERAATEQQLYITTQKGNELKKQEAELMRLSERNESGPSYLTTPHKIDEVTKARQENVQQQQAQQEAVAESKRKEAETERRLAAERSKMHGIRADILENRANVGAQTATTLGGMDPFERAQAVAAAKQLVKTGNPDMLPPELRQQALAVLGPEGQKILERHGQQTPEYRELGKLAPNIAPKDTEELRRQAGEERDQQERDRMKGEAEFAKTVSAAGKDLGGFIVSAFKQLVDEAKREINAQMKIGKF
jgi:hypothetical protein